MVRNNAELNKKKYWREQSEEGRRWRQRGLLLVRSMANWTALGHRLSRSHNHYVAKLHLLSGINGFPACPTVRFSAEKYD